MPPGLLHQLWPHLKKFPPFRWLNHHFSRRYSPLKADLHTNADINIRSLFIHHHLSLQEERQHMWTKWNAKKRSSFVLFWANKCVCVCFRYSLCLMIVFPIFAQIYGDYFIAARLAHCQQILIFWFSRSWVYHFLIHLRFLWDLLNCTKISESVDPKKNGLFFRIASERSPFICLTSGWLLFSGLTSEIQVKQTNVKPCVLNTKIAVL